MNYSAAGSVAANLSEVAVAAGDTVTRDIALVPVPVPVPVVVVPTAPINPSIRRSPPGNKTYLRKRGVARYTLLATVSGPAGVLAGTTVYLQSRTSTKRAWKNSYRRVTNASGRASVAFRSKRKATTYYRWVVVSQAPINYAATRSQRIVVR